MTSKPNSAYPNAPIYQIETDMEPATSHSAFVVMQTAQPKNPLGFRSTLVTCQACNQRQMTTIEYRANTKTHLIAAILFVFTCCCCIPYCMNSCKSVEHHCSNCGAYLGTYKN